jgi:hypothetical protein
MHACRTYSPASEWSRLGRPRAGPPAVTQADTPDERSPAVTYTHKAETPLRPTAKFCAQCDGRLVALLPHPDNPTRWLLAFEYEPDGFTPSTRQHICRPF